MKMAKIKSLLLLVAMATLFMRCSCSKDEKSTITSYRYPVFVGEDSIAYNETWVEYTENSDGASFPTGGGSENSTGSYSKIKIMNSQGQDIATLYTDDNIGKNINDIMFNKANGQLFVLRKDNITVMELTGKIVKTISDTTNHSVAAYLGPFSPDGQYYTIISSKGFFSIKDYNGAEVYINYKDDIRDWNSFGGLLFQRDAIGEGESKDSSILLNGVSYSCHMTTVIPWGWQQCLKDSLRILYQRTLTNDTVYESNFPQFDHAIVVGRYADILKGAITKSIFAFSPGFNQVAYGTQDNIKLFDFNKKELASLKINSR